MKTVLVGQMDQQVVIRRWSKVKDSAGGLREVNTDSWTLWAAQEGRKGFALTNNQQMTWSYKQVFTVYYESDRRIYSNDTVDYDGQRFRINSVSNQTEGNRQMIEIETSTTGTAITDNLSTMLQTVNFPGNGTDTINVPELIGQVPKLAFADGVEYIIVIGTPNPAEKEVGIDSVAGDTVWSVAFMPTVKCTVAYAGI